MKFDFELGDLVKEKENTNSNKKGILQITFGDNPVVRVISMRHSSDGVYTPEIRVAESFIADYRYEEGIRADGRNFRLATENEIKVEKIKEMFHK
jgi:hypothetical protein